MYNDDKKVHDIETEHVRFKFNYKTFNGVAGAHAIIG